MSELRTTTVSGVAGWLPYLTPAQRGTIGCNSLPFVCPSARPSHTCCPVLVRVSLNPRPCNTSIAPEAYNVRVSSSNDTHTYTCVALSAFYRGEKSNDDDEKIPAACINEERRGPEVSGALNVKTAARLRRKRILIFQTLPW